MTKRWRVAPNEIGWVLGWSALLLALTSVPYLLGVYLSSPEMHFGGFVYNVEDCNSYIAKMQQGARGAWLFHIVYTSEDHAGGLFFLFHIALGRLAVLAGLSLVVVYHLARLICGLILLFATYFFIAYFVACRALRRIAFLLICFSGGLGWLLISVGQPDWLGSLPLDLLLPEAFTFLIVYAFPHIALARALMLGAFTLALAAFKNGSVRLALLAGGVIFLVGVIVPFYVAITWVVLGGYVLALALKRKSLPLAEMGLAAIASFIPAPVVLYSVYTFSTNPVFRAWSRQNLVLSPHPLHYLAAYAVVGPLALAGALYLLKRSDEKWLFLLAWVAVVPPLLYAPFSLQRRLLEGFQIPLCILAAFGLSRYVLPAVRRFRPLRYLERFKRYTRPRMRRFATTVIILATVPTNVLLIAGNSVEVARRPWPIFHERTVVEALDWLGTHTDPYETVLSSKKTGNYVPARAGNRVFLGHGPETIDHETKQALVEKFFQTETTDEFRLKMLRDYGLAYVFYGPQEGRLGAPAFGNRSFLSKVYGNQEVEIYKVLHQDKGY